MILSQDYKTKHYFFLIKIMVACFFLSTTITNASAQVQSGKKEDGKTENLPFKGRWGIKTNAVDWLLTVPNFGVEFDLGNTIRNKQTIGANLKWNWNTSQKYKPSIVFNLFDARVEWRQYFRTRRRNASATLKDGIFKYLNENILTTKRKNPRDWRAYYWGVYANASSYNFKLGKQGRQGNAYGAGVSIGYTAPLYGYRNNYVDLEVGASFGLLYTSYDVYEHDAESDCYPRIASKSKEGHLVPFPVPTDLRVAFVYRFVSVKDKYKQSITRRIDIRNEKKAKLNEAINKMRFRIDSISSVYKRKGLPMSDSLLNKEERKEWQKMQDEILQKAQEEADKKLQQRMADSLGIQISDSVPLTKAQQKALREAVKAARDAQEDARKQKAKEAKAAEEGAGEGAGGENAVEAEKDGKKNKDGKKDKDSKKKKEKKKKKSDKAEAPDGKAAETALPPAEATGEKEGTE